jgi:hypothetical protein
LGSWQTLASFAACTQLAWHLKRGGIFQGHGTLRQGQAHLVTAGQLRADRCIQHGGLWKWASNAQRHAEIAPEVQALCAKYNLRYNTGSLFTQFTAVMKRIWVHTWPARPALA